jgi:Nucleotidyltransferase of unknown function (DUF6036)
MLIALVDQEATFMIVGAYALAVHGVPRSTGDIDIWVRPDPENAQRVWRALVYFGAPVEAMGLTPADLSKPGTIYQIGQPPRRIDIITRISGVEFDAAWKSRAVETVEGLELTFLGREDLLQNKLASARIKDLADVELLRKQG